MQTGGIVILDFGSQFTHLIARRIREMGVYSEILPFDSSLKEIEKRQPKGIVLSGGPSSVYDEGAPLRGDLDLIIKKFPTMGLCFGMQLYSHVFGGKVEGSSTREYGRNIISWENKKSQTVWMSHGDVVKTLPEGAEGLAKSSSGHWAAMRDNTRGKVFLGYQFHPEVHHTQDGDQLIKNFVFEICEASVNWQGKALLDHLNEYIRATVGEKSKVLCGLSGGVDSTVTAVLLTQILGPERVECVFVDTGLMRENEASEVTESYKTLKLNFRVVEAQKEFLSELSGVTDPEKKRKIIGRVFVEVFDAAVSGKSFDFLAQGTLYPDVIESVSLRGQSVTIKTHHNVGGLPEKMKLKLVEPLRELFKDEVRTLGRQLKINENLLMRHPFPGPGLAIRILGSVNEADLKILRQADKIFTDELKSQNLYSKVWQAFAVLLPIQTVGVMGDGRTYDRAIGLRAVTSTDAMTADWYPFSGEFLAFVSNRITNEVKGINRVLYDISSKPPATIEWE